MIITMKRFLWFMLVIVVAANVFAQRNRAAGRLEPPVRILFVGNSLTSENNLPAMVCRLALAAGKSAACVSVVGPGYAIEDHLARGVVQQHLANERWSYVVMQQGPSALAASRVNLREFTGKIAPLIRAAGATPALYSVWPERARSFDFPRVSESYRLAAQDVGGLFLPVGDTWLAAWKYDEDLPLYGPDQFHPSPAGTYLAALVIYRALFGEIPEAFAGLDVAEQAAGASLGLTPESLRVLVAAARL